MTYSFVSGLNLKQRFLIRVFNYCYSNDGLPINYTIAANKKRIPLTVKRQFLKTGIMKSAKDGTIEVPSEVKKVLLEHLEGEITEEEPDEQTLEILEDIYVKAGEMGKY